MKIIKKIVNGMVRQVKESNYNCSPSGFYKPKKEMK